MPDDPKTWLAQARCAARAGDTKLTGWSFTKATKLAPGDVAGQQQSPASPGQTLLGMSRLDEAQTALLRAAATGAGKSPDQAGIG